MTHFVVVVSERHGYIGGESREYTCCKTEIDGRLGQHGGKLHSVVHPPGYFLLIRTRAEREGLGFGRRTPRAT